MSQFVWDDVYYEFDALTCYNGMELIELPDGTVLKVNGWHETDPPQPVNIVPADFMSKMGSRRTIKARAIGVV